MLYKVVGKLGSPIKIDNTTEFVLRGRFARICVEVDTDHPLKHVVRIGGLIHKIEYEGVGLICFNCGKMSHRKDQCSLNVCTNNVVHDDAGTKVPSDKADAYSPWIFGW